MKSDDKDRRGTRSDDAGAADPAFTREVYDVLAGRGL